MPKILIDVEDIPYYPLPLKDGKLHLHLNRYPMSNRFAWMVVQRKQAGICDTKRCMIVKLNPMSKIPSDMCSGVQYNGDGAGKVGHDWQPPKWGTMVCVNCGEIREFDVRFTG